MAVAEILMTQKERFTIFEDGHIVMEKGTYTPSQAPIYDVFPMPHKKENEDIRNWQLECRNIGEMNALAHQKQEKEFKKHLIEVRRNYRKQEMKRKKAEKSEQIQIAKRQNSGKSGIRAYIMRLLSR